jgi:hypothetical protein
LPQLGLVEGPVAVVLDQPVITGLEPRQGELWGKRSPTAPPATIQASNKPEESHG